jgi:hypothetical protein
MIPIIASCENSGERLVVLERVKETVAADIDKIHLRGDTE